jgi:Type IV secretion system pilin
MNLFTPIAVAHAVTISTAIPGTSTSTTSAGAPGAMINNFYQFAILIGGLLAFAVIVYAGVKYMASAGNPTGQGDAKEWIWSALLGLLLLAGAYLVLTLINPDLKNLTLPSLTPAAVTTSSAAAQSNSGPGTATSTACAITKNGGTSGTCPNDPGTGASQHCCNLDGTAICTLSSC